MPDEQNNPRVRMIDVGDKAVTARAATASARVTLTPDVFDAVVAGRVPKGDVLTTARVAGIMAAKRTADLLPLCHPLPLDAVEVDVRPAPPDAVSIVATVRTRARTGVEMEALTAVSVAALTVYDMCKSLQKSIEIGPIRLEHKHGGRSGEYDRSASSG